MLGRLRRDETQRAATLDPYLQAEWDTPTWTLAAGVRRARVSLSAEDRYLALYPPRTIADWVVDGSGSIPAPDGTVVLI